MTDLVDENRLDERRQRSGEAPRRDRHRGATAEDEASGLDSLELFFDLVFVFTITQLTAVLAHHPNGEALAQIVLMLAAIWWMYGAFAWLTNAVPPDRRGAAPAAARPAWRRSSSISLTIPTAFTEDGVVFACAYLAVIVVHTVLYTQSASWSVAGVWSFARMNFVAGALILVGSDHRGRLPSTCSGASRSSIFAVIPALVPEEAGWIGPDHFVERHGLVVMVALGESVVAVGIGASGLDDQLGAARGGDPRPDPERGALVGLLHGGRRGGRGRPRAG